MKLIGQKEDMSVDDAMNAMDMLKEDLERRRWRMKNNPQSFITEDYIIARAQRIEDNRNRPKISKSTMRPFALIPPDLYHLDPAYWSEQLENTKKFKINHPYFCV